MVHRSTSSGSCKDITGVRCIIFLEEDMPKNITTRYIGNDQSEWIPQENDTLEDLIKLKK